MDMDIKIQQRLAEKGLEEIEYDWNINKLEGKRGREGG